MDLERSPPPEAASPADAAGGAACSICLDPVVGRCGGRFVAKLQCGHDFHLDCIGSAFNAKGAMQCPNCRKIEKGRWLYASGHRPSPDIDIGGWVIDETYDITSDLDEFNSSSQNEPKGTAVRSVLKDDTQCCHA